MLPLMDTYNTDYDLSSVMHYGVYDFAIAPSEPTVLPKVSTQAMIGQRDGLSVLDAAKLLAAYKCPLTNDGITTSSSVEISMEVPSKIPDVQEPESKFCYLVETAKKTAKLEYTNGKGLVIFETVKLRL